MTAFVMSGLSNAITQIITKRYKFKESFWYGVQCCPPYAHFVYKLIDRLFGEGPENSVRFSAKNFNRHFKRSMRFMITAHVFIGSCGFVKKKRFQMYKVLFDQLCWKPVITMYYFIMNGFLNGGTVAAVAGNIRAEFLAAMIDTWRVWPIVSYCNQRFVPVHFRSFVLDIVAFFFDMMMSIRVAVDK